MKIGPRSHYWPSDHGDLAPDLDTSQLLQHSDEVVGNRRHFGCHLRGRNMGEEERWVHQATLPSTVKDFEWWNLCKGYIGSVEHSKFRHCKSHLAWASYPSCRASCPLAEDWAGRPNRWGCWRGFGDVGVKELGVKELGWQKFVGGSEVLEAYRTHQKRV